MSMLVARGRRGKTFRCAKYVDTAKTLAYLGASTRYIRSRKVRPAARSHIDAAIANFEAVWRGTRHSSRYSDGGHAVLYTATSKTVARIERTHWLIELLFKKTRTTKFEGLFIYECSVVGKYLDYKKNWKTRKELVHPKDYTVCQGIALSAMRSGADYIVVPSARKFGGTCVPVFSELAANVIGASGPFDLHWDSSKGEPYLVSAGRKNYIRVEDVFSML